MRISFSEQIEPAGGDAVREPLLRKGRPLVVDVDEVLLDANSFPGSGISGMIGPSNTKTEAVAASIPDGSKAASRFDPSRPLYDQDAVTFLLQALGEGRPVYLCSEIHPEPLVNAVAQYLGVFTLLSAEQDSRHPAGDIADLPAALRQGFDYLGKRMIALPELATRVARPGAFVTPAVPKADARTWLKLLRVHQYVKNALVLVPLLTAHKFGLVSAANALLSMVAFSLCASSAYILNDLLDIKSDRAHPAKRTRPIASGTISASQAIPAMILALAAATAIAISISVEFSGVLLGYFALTTAYSFLLKRVAIVDVVVLASLYTIRVFGGAIAIDVPMSEWLFAFSLFIFMSLALVKRHIELDGQPEASVLAARGYQTQDKTMIATLAATCGFNAVVIFTLYISSEAVRSLYSHPQLLWIGCPVLMYWIGRVMLFAQRGLIDDDPVIFALRDRVSWFALGTIGIIMLAAI